jgi:hypothetical protein
MSNRRVARTESLLAALRHAAQDPHNTLIVLLEPLRVGLDGADSGHISTSGSRILLGAEDLGALKRRERLERLAVRSRGRESSKGESERSEEGETHDCRFWVLT